MAEFKLGRLRFVWKGTWTAAQSYVKDDIVKYGGISYVCMTGHTADADFDVDFTAAPSKWQKMSVGLEWKNNPWTPSVTYKDGDVVKHGGKTYVCIANHESDSLANGGFYLDETAGYWDLLIDGTEWKGNWAVSTYYKLGDTVKYNSYTYICTTAHTSAGTVASGLENDSGKWSLSSEGFKWKDAWQADTRYVVNDVVKYGASLWICNAHHTSGSTYDPLKFNLFVSGLEFEDSWSSLAEYQLGDIVTYGGYSYVSSLLNTNKIPPSEPTFWELLTTGYKTRGAYESGQSYKVGDVVKYGGKSYVAIVEVQPSESPNALPASWELVSDGFRWLGDWDLTPTDSTYKVGDVVKYLSTSYICILEHTPADEGTLNENRPDTDRLGVYWNSLAEGADTNVLSRRGDLVTRNAIQNERLPKGANGTFLKAGASDLAWSKVGDITRVFYVSTDGIDDPERGTTLSDPFRTIKYACDHVRTLIVPTFNSPAVINVKTGVFTEVFPISVPKFTSLVGDELRMSIVQPTEETAHLNKFYLRDSTTLRNFTMRGATGNPVGTGYTEANQYGTKRPTGGAWVSLDPGTGPNDESVWVGARSPYIQNVTTFGDYAVGQKIDGSLHNGGNKSLTSNDFTQLISNGIGAWCTNQGRAELVSVFSYYAYIGYLCENGGVIRATNGNNSYGTYGSVSEGVDPTEISRTAEVDNRRLDAVVDRVQTNGSSLLYVEYLNAGETYSNATYNFVGPGTANIIATPTFNDGAVAEVRVLDDGDGYLGVTNNAQQGTAIDIRLSASDTTVTNGYNGMRITLVDGAGSGQYGIAHNFDGGAKDLYILNESFEPITITETDAVGDLLSTIAGDIARVYVGMPLMFLGTTYGGVNTTTVYYVTEVNTGDATFSVSTSPSGTPVELTTVTTGTFQGHALGWNVFAKPRTSTVNAATTTSPVRITTNSRHGLVDGFAVTFSGVGGMTDLNDNTYYVIRVSDTEFDLYTSYTLLTPVDGTAFSAFTTGGSLIGQQAPLPYLDTTTRYSIEPRPVFSTGAGAVGTAVRTLGINTVSVSSGGKGFATPPTISLAGPDTVIGNSTASGTVTISGDVTDVVIQSKGTGFTSAPTLSFVGGGLPSSYTLWASGITVAVNEYIRTTDRNIYKVTVAGEMGPSVPSHTTGTDVSGTATLLYVGTIASATATTTSTIKTVELLDGGVGFTTPPSVIVNGTSGSGAIISAQISQVIGSISVDTQGANYTSPPTVTLIGGEPLEFAEAEAVLSAVVSSITIIEGGNGYNPNTTTVSLSGGTGTGALVDPVIDFGAYEDGVTPGVITGIVIREVMGVPQVGSGYNTPPVVIIEDTGNGVGASAQSNIIGSVASITVTNRGRGYQTTPNVQITGGGGSAATAHANKTGSVNTLTVVDGGHGWVGTPSLQFTGGGGSSASAIVTAMDTVIDTVTIDDSGANYTSNPALAVIGGGGSGAILRPKINGTVQTVTITDPGSDYSSTPVISFVGGGNYKSSIAGLKYYANASAALAIGIKQRTQTLASINRVRTVMKAIVANTSPTEFQSGITRTAASGGYAKPAGIDQAIDSWINTIYYTIQNSQDSLNSGELLALNRLFIQTEVRAYIDANYSGTADATWNRDVGLIVDAVANDISGKGVNYSLNCGMNQAFLVGRADPGQVPVVEAAIDYVGSLLHDIVQNIVVTPTFDNTSYTWKGVWAIGTAYSIDDVVVVNNATYICLAAHTANSLFTVDLALSRWEVKDNGQITNSKVFEPDSLTAISNNVGLIKGLVQKNPGSVTYATASALLNSNKDYIKAEVIAFVNTTYTDFDYSQALCARDVGFIVDAIVYDTVNAKVNAEPVATASTTGVVSTITVTNGGEGYSDGVTITISGGGTPTTTATAVPVIDDLTGAITSFTMTNKGKGYSTDPITVGIVPDTGSGVIARCRLAGTNVSRIVIIEPGSGYTSGPFMKLVDPNNSIEAQFKVRVADGVLGQPVFESRGANWLTAEGEVTGDGYADIRQTGSFVYVKSLTNVPTPGANIQFAGNSEYYKLVTVREVFGPDGLIGGRQLLLANKTFIQEEVVSYLNNFTYDATTCERDVGYIIDALAEDIVYGSNARLLAAVQQYRRGTYSLFDNQTYQTAFALQYLQDQLATSQKAGTLDAMSTLKADIATALSTSATAITRANANMDTIIDILDNGLSAVPTILTPDPTGYNTGYSDARRLLLANTAFIKAEVTAYIAQQIAANTVGFVGLEYNSATCERDVGYVIDALRYDLTYGGNLQSLIAGTAYYSYSELQVDANDKVATLAAYNHMRTIIGSILQGNAISAIQVNISQDVSGTGGSSAAAAFAQDRINDIRVTINTGTAPASINPDTTWVAGGILAARADLLSTKATIQSSIITYIETTYPTLVFNRATCSRDVGYIIDAIGWDIAFGSNFQSIKSGMAYYRANASNVLTGISGLNTLLSPVIEWMKNEEFYKPLPDAVFPNGNANAEENNGKDVLIANREWLAAQAWRYYANTYPSTEINETLFRQELDQIVLAVAHDLTYLGNTAVVAFGRSFYSGASLRIPGLPNVTPTIKTQYLAVLDWLNTTMQAVSQNTIVNAQVGLPAGLAQDRTLSPGDGGTGVEIDNLMSDFYAIIDLTTSTIGVTVTEGPSSFAGYAGALTSAKTSLEDSKTALKTAVTDWIDTNFVNFTYDRDICFRDVGLIVQAVADDIFGDVAKSVEAGQRYYAATAALVLSEQKPQTIAAIDKINSIAQKVIRNETFTRTQNNAFQERFPSITGGGDAGPAIADRVRIVRRILETGSDLDKIKQLLLDNKEYMKSEVIAYINASYENLDYNQDICARDVGLIVDAICYDIYGGFSRSREAGLRYYSSESGLIAINEQNGPTTDAIRHLRDIIQSILIDEAPSVTFQEVLQRTSTPGSYSIPQVSNLVIDTKINSCIDELLSVIENGPSSLPIGLYKARLQISPPLTVFNSPVHETATTTRSKYSQVRLTGHDFLNIGTGSKNDTNYPGIPVNNPDQNNEVVEIGGGRVFYTSTDQDGNFRVGELFRVEQSTGIATLNADAFNLSGLNELSLGGITLGGTNAVIREFSTDPTFFANSDNIVPTQKAIKTYIQSALGSGGGNIAVNAVIAGQTFLSGDELTTIGNIPMRFTSTGGYQVESGVNSTSAITGSLRITNNGGLGVAGNIYAGGVIVAGDTLTVVNGVQGTAIGTSTRSTGAFTTLTANTEISVTSNTASDDYTTGALIVTGGVGIGGNLNVNGSFSVGSLAASGIDNTPIGAIGRSSGAFTTLGANAQVSFTGNIASSSTGTGSVVVTGGAGISGALNIGGALTANGSNATISFAPTGTGSVTINPATVGNINKMNIGATTAGTGAFTTLSANGAVTLTAGTASTTVTTGTLVVTGGVGVSGQVTAATLVETSSIAFKENVEPITGALDAIMRLAGVTYDRKDSNIHEAGLIAEEVNKVLPELVAKDANGNPYGIQYTKLTAYLIEAIKTLNSEITKLKEGK